MKFEIQFNKQIYIEQMTLNFDEAWSVNLKENKKRLIWAIPMILFGGLIIYGENNVGFLLLAIGIHYLINFNNYYSYYKKSKRKYFELVETEKNGHLDSNENSIWEFNDEYFRYKDYKYETKIKWKTFKSTRVIEKNLFIDLYAEYNLSYIISETELGTENFNKVVEFVKSKIG